MSRRAAFGDGGFLCALAAGRPRYPGQRPASAEQRGDASIVYHGAARGALHNRAKERGAGEKAGKGIEILFLLRT